MREVGAFEAKTHLSELLKIVETGEHVRITRRGRAVADIVPVSDTTAKRRAAIAQIKALKASLRMRLSADDILNARDEGWR